MLHIKERNRILIEDVTIAKAARFSFFQYSLLVIAIILLVMRAGKNPSTDTTENEKLVEEEIEDQKNATHETITSECGYKIHLSKEAITAWEPFSVEILFQPDESCHFDDQGGGSVFRVQLYSIYELTSKTSTYLGNGRYKVDIMLTIPTTYIVMVFATYIHHLGLEPRRHINPILRQLPGSPFELNVSKGKYKSPSSSTQFCTSEQSGSAAGRWVKCGGIIPKIERCGPWQGTEFDFDKINGFHWLPYTCQYHKYTNDEIKRCFARNGWDSIVFAGDSHMRYRAYHWATRLYGACTSCVKTHIKMVFDKVPRIEWVFDARGTRLPLSFKNITLPYEKYVHPKVRRSKFSTPFSQDALKSKLFILNFGHWVLRESYDTEFIEAKLHAYARAAKYLIQQGKVVVWVNTVSLPWRMDRAVENWRENTSPYRVRHFNEMADKIIKQYDIPLVDAYHVSDGRVGATHDQTHYTKRLPGNEYGGVVEIAVSNVIFNKLCNEYL